MKVSYNYLTAKASEIPEDFTFKRVGIIPYFFHQSVPYYFLMMDSKFQEWTDCGGVPKYWESWVDTAIRETKEESRGFFKFDKNFLLSRGTVCWREDHRIAIIFCPFKIVNLKHADSLCHRYRRDYLKGIERKDQRHLLENSDIDYYTEKRIKDESKTIYKLVRCLLRAFFRISGVSNRKPYQYQRCYDYKARRYYNNPITTHESITYPQTRDYDLESESIF